MKIGNVEMRVSEATRRDWAAVKEAANDFFTEMRDYRTLAFFGFCCLVAAVIMWLPFLVDESELLWK